MKNLQIGRGWSDQIRPVPVFQHIARANRQSDLNHGDDRQLSGEIDGLVMVEGNLVAFAI